MRCPSFMWAYSVTELSTLDVIYLCVCASGIRVKTMQRKEQKEKDRIMLI